MPHSCRRPYLPMPSVSPSRYPVTRTARVAIQAIADGSPEVILIVPGWLGNEQQRHLVIQKFARSTRTPPVHARWIWLRETEDGRAETAFLAWPCTVLHPAGYQCRAGRVIHGNTPWPGRIPVPARSR
jgi:hypothetical protein